MGLAGLPFRESRERGFLGVPALFGERGYTAVRKNAGWLKSAVFASSFRLSRRDDALGYPEYTLASK
jgi:hypothetical protein